MSLFSARDIRLNVEFDRQRLGRLEKLIMFLKQFFEDLVTILLSCRQSKELQIVLLRNAKSFLEER